MILESSGRSALLNIKKNVVASTEIYINVFDVLSKHFFIFRLKKYKKVGDNPFDLEVFHAYHLGATAFC